MRSILVSAILVILSGCAAPASETVTRAVPVRDLDAVSLVREGLYLYERSRFVDAELKFRQALYLFPNALNVQENLAAALESSQQIDESEQVYRALLQRQPEALRIRVALARLSATRGDLRRARELYEEILSIAVERGEQDRAADVARSLASLLFRRGLEEDAGCYSELAFFYRPTDVERGRHARILNAVGRYGQALAVTEGSRDPQVLVERALAHVGGGDLQSARDVVREVVEQREGDVATLAEARALEALLRRALLPAERSSDADGQETLPEVAAATLVVWPPRIVAFYTQEIANEKEAG